MSTTRRIRYAAVLTAVIAAMLPNWPKLRAEDVPSTAPADLVRKAVQNEVGSSPDRLKFMFRQFKDTPHGSETKLIVETRDASAGLLVAINGKPLTPEQRQQEEARLQNLINNPDALAKKRKSEKEDTQNTERILKALPDAFLYEYDGTETGRTGLGKDGDELVRLKFRPNPKYDPPTHTEQVLTGMQGSMLIDATEYRLAKIDGMLFKQVGFGWGILGHLDKGGRFLVEQGDVGDKHWEVTHMTLDFTGKVLLVKSLKIKTNELYTDFHPAPPDLTFAEGVEFLKKQPTAMGKNQPPCPPSEACDPFSQAALSTHR